MDRLSVPVALVLMASEPVFVEASFGAVALVVAKLALN